MSTPKARRSTFQKQEGRSRAGSKSSGGLKRFTAKIGKKVSSKTDVGKSNSGGDPSKVELPQLYMQVIGARGIVTQEASGFLYCTISLEEFSTQTNYVRSENEPTWDEEFVFWVQNKMSCLEVSAYHIDEEGRATHYLGEVNVAVHTLGSHRGITDWFPLTDPSSGKSKGELQLQLFNSLSRSSTDAMRDLDEVYKGLLDNLRAVDLSFFSHFFDQVDSSDSDKVAASVVTLFAYLGKELPLFQHVIQVEVDQTISTSVLFRSNSMAIRLISVYTKLICSGYLRQVLSPLMEIAMTDSERYEVDPTRFEGGAPPEALLKKNQENLLGLADQFLYTILASLSKIPAQVVSVCKMLEDIVEPKFPGFSPRALGGVYFLRLVCPAIVAPTAYGLLTTHPRGAKHRALVLVGKMLQNAANKTHFKEAIMEPLNSFLEKSEAPLDGFLRSLAGLPIGDFQTIELLKASSVVDQCTNMAKFLRVYEPKMRSALEDTEEADSSKAAQLSASLDAFNGVLTELSSKDEVYEKPYDSSQLGPELKAKGVLKLHSGALERNFITEGEDDAGTMNTIIVWQRPCRPGVDRYLLEKMRALYLTECQQSIKNKQMDWAALGRNVEFKKLTRATCELQKVDLQQMVSRDKKMAFWLNVYNLMWLHLCCSVGPPSTNYAKRMLYTNYSYRVGSGTFTLMDIENGILRGNPMLAKGQHQFGPSDARRAYTLTLEPRIHFVLCHLQTHSPALMVVSSSSLERDLNLAARLYLNRLMDINSSRRELTLPKLFVRQREDFVGHMAVKKEDAQNRELLNWTFQFLRTDKKLNLTYLLSKGCSITYQRSAGKLRSPAMELELNNDLQMCLTDDGQDDEVLPDLVARTMRNVGGKMRRGSKMKSPRVVKGKSPRTSSRSSSGTLPQAALPAAPAVIIPIPESSSPPASTAPAPVMLVSPRGKTVNVRVNTMQRGESIMNMDILRESMNNMTGRVISRTYDAQQLLQGVLAEVSKTISLTTAFHTGKTIRSIKLKLLEMEDISWTTQSLEVFKSQNKLDPPQLTALQKVVVSKNKQDQMLKLMLAIQTAVVDISFLLENMAKSMQQSPEWDPLPVSKQVDSICSELEGLLEKIRAKNLESAPLQSALTLGGAVQPEIDKISGVLKRIEKQLSDLDLSDEEGQIRVLKFASVLTYVKKQLASPTPLPPFEPKNWSRKQLHGVVNRFEEILTVLKKLIATITARLDVLKDTVARSVDHKELTDAALLVRNVRSSIYTRF